MHKIRALAIAVCLFTASCHLTDRHWTYRLTREAADSGYWSFTRNVDHGAPGEIHINNGYAAAVFIGVVLLLPPILDTAFLPIAGTHDLFFIN